MGLYLDHVNTVLGKLREAPITALSTDTSSEAFRAQLAVRRAVSRVWNARQWSFKIRDYSLSTVSGQADYVLPSYVGEPFSIKIDTNPYKIHVVREADFDKYLPNPTRTGPPEYARMFEMTGVLNQPASASTISVASSSASDTTQKVVVKGLVGGYVDIEEISLAGTGSVSGLKSFTEVFSVTKSDTTVGAVTLTAGAVTLAVVAPQERVHRRRIMRFYPEPAAVNTITVKHFGQITPMTNAYEDTEIPTRWDYVVDQFGYALALQSKGQDQTAEFRTQFDVAGKFLETDMASEEHISSEQIISPSRWGNFATGEISRWDSLPGNYGYTYY